jgi:photosystem II PsbY protein
VVAPAVGWVLYNILQPALNQLNRMRGSQQAAVAGLGLGATAAGMAWAPEASAAAQEVVAAVAAGDDNRGTLLLLVVAPAIGWVLYNILQPALNQLNRMRND